MTRGGTRIALVLFLALFVNLPLVHSTWTRWQVDRSGADVTAEVVGAETLGTDRDPTYWLTFTLPEEVDPEQEQWGAEVDRATYEQARASRVVEARVVPDQPSAHRVDGEIRSSLGLVGTIVADAILLVILLLVWRFGRRSPPPLVIAAIGDVERCPPGTALEQVEGDLYLVRGEVTGIDVNGLVLDAGEREVRVLLDGHHNHVGYQQPAQVRGRLVG